MRNPEFRMSEPQKDLLNRAEPSVPQKPVSRGSITGIDALRGAYQRTQDKEKAADNAEHIRNLLTETTVKPETEMPVQSTTVEPFTFTRKAGLKAAAVATGALFLDRVANKFGLKTVNPAEAAPVANDRLKVTESNQDTAPIQIDPSFEKYWNEHGGLAQQGLPVSEPFIEKAEDERPYKVQYFERAKFELHPEHAGTPYEILLSRMGVEEFEKKYPGEKANANTPIDTQFLKYWQEHGALAQQGFAIGPARDEVAEDGKTYRTQYFERAVFEYHPENAGTPYEVLLKRIGAKQYKDKYPNGHGGTEAPPPEFGGWRSEFADSEGRLTVKNKTKNYGFEDNKTSLVRNLTKLAEGVKKFFPEDKFVLGYHDSADQVVQTANELIGQGYEIKWEVDNNWETNFPGGGIDKRFYAKKGNLYELHENYPVTDNTNLKNALNAGATNVALSFFASKGQSGVAEPEGYNLFVKEQYGEPKKAASGDFPLTYVK